MKRKAQPRKSPAKGSKPATFDIKVQDPKRLELEKLINQRKRITRKIRNLPKLEQRLRIEDPDVSLQQLVERLQKRKSDLDKALAKHDGFSKRKRRPSPLSPVRMMVMERSGPMSIEEVLAGMYHRVAIDWSKYLPSCPTLNGRAVPVLTRIGTRLEAAVDLNHNSSASYYYIGPSYSNGQLVWNIGAWLNDDASAWRDDDPDTVAWYDNICIYLPMLECDSTVDASLSIRFEGHITSEADDHNEIRQYVYVAHSDENGNLPASLSFGDKYPLNDIDLSGEIGLPEDIEGPIIDSDWVTASMSFSAKANVVPTVAVGTCTELSAQDGTLRIGGDWRISDLVYSITPN